METILVDGIYRHESQNKIVNQRSEEKYLDTEDTEGESKDFRLDTLIYGQPV